MQMRENEGQMSSYYCLLLSRRWRGKNSTLCCRRCPQSVRGTTQIRMFNTHGQSVLNESPLNVRTPTKADERAQFYYLYF